MRENVLALGYENRYTLYFLLQANKLACNLSESHEPGGSELIPEGRTAVGLSTRSGFTIEVRDYASQCHLLAVSSEA